MKNRVMRAISVLAAVLLSTVALFACSGKNYSVSLSKDKAELTVGEELTLELTATGFTPENTAWDSSDKAVVSVEGGKVKALSQGAATVTASIVAPDGKTYDSKCEITVTAAAAVKKADYKVEIYKQKKDRSGYTKTEKTNPKWQNDVGTEISVTKATLAQFVTSSEIRGYEFDEDNENNVTSVVLPEGGASLKLYFNIKTTPVTYKVEGKEDTVVYVDYGDKLEVPTNPTKAADGEYEYDFDAWYKAGTEEKWSFVQNNITEPISLEAKFTPVELQSVSFGFVGETLTVAGVEVPMFELSAGDIAAIAVKIGKEGDLKPVTLDGKGIASVKLRAGDYKISYEIGGVTKEQSFTVGDKSVSELISAKAFEAKLGGNMGDYPSFSSGWSKLADDKLDLNGYSWVYADATEDELTDRYYVEANVNLKTNGKFVGVLAACDYADISATGTGRKLSFSLSGGNKIYVGNGGAGGWGQFDANGYVNVRLSQATNHKFGLLRDKSVYYLIVDDRLVNTYKDDSYGKCTFGFASYSSDGNAVFSDIKYTRVPSAVDRLAEFFMTTPQLGGGFTIAKGYHSTDNGKNLSAANNKVVPSFGGGFTVTRRDSGTLSGPSYVFNGGTAGSIYYVEADFENVDGWAGILINALDGEPTYNKGWYGYGVLGTTMYLHRFAPSWNSGDSKGKVIDTAGKFKLGVARINDRYMVFANGKLVLSEVVTAYSVADNSVALPADNESGFGLFIGTNNGAKATFKNFRFTMDLDEIMEITGYAAFTAQDGVTVKQAGKTMTDKLIEGVTAEISVEVPEGKTVGELQVLCNGKPVELTATGGKLTFVPTSGDYDISVSFADKGTATLTVDVKPYEITVDGTAYPLYDLNIDPADVTVRVTNLGAGTERTYNLTALSGNSYSLDSGYYRVSVEYANNAYVTTLELNKDATEKVVGYVSPAYLGGEITIPNASGVDTTYKSYNNAAVTATSGSNWKLENNRRDSVTMSSHTYVFQNGFSGTKYYVEGVFDTSESTDIINKFGGLLVSHGPENLADTSDVKLIAGFYGKSLAICNIPTNWGINDLRLLVNIDELGLDYNPSAVKLGVVRDGVNYYFFIDDTFVASYIYKGVTTECGVGVAASPATMTVRHFNYSADSALINALIAEAPAAQNKEIDIYVIAGQSNASGYAIYNPLTVTDDTLLYGTNNILYAGDAESSANQNTVTVHRELGWSLARIGLGADKNKFGAEAGMAQTLKSYYNAESGKTAGIIKYAHGGTALLNNVEGENKCNGNWVPPSYQATLSSGVTEKTGGLYRLLLAQVTKNVAELKEAGYTKINFKGLFWMQGESDKGNPTEYRKAFGYFASDIRRDLGEIADTDLSHLPIIVGEISRTSGSAASGTVNTNNAFIEMQDKLPQSVSDVYVVKSGKFDINEWRNGANVAVGTDSWHWSQADMITIGNMVGECILENILA